jgi:peptide deformylase
MNPKLAQILLLGNPRLHEISRPIAGEELPHVKVIIKELHDILMAFREHYGAGRAIAAPQIGVMKRLIYMYTDEPVALINPIIFDRSEAMMEVWDDCMCFPHLEVKVQRHRRCKIRFRGPYWQEHVWNLEGDLSELLQHEADHLDGILATQRAIDEFAFRWKKR